VTGGDVAAAALQTKAIAAIVNVARVIASVHIILSLLCGEQKRQNAPREVFGRVTQRVTQNDPPMAYAFLSISRTVIFIPTKVAALIPRSPRIVESNSGIAKSVQVQNTKITPRITFHTTN
jgi:hypothetical protein